ncbi:MAG: pyridoxamine 5'-phosphate oxidase family protein [Rhodobacteraceae bacterium]|nr:pyridoxamine 5'-phosphate oxidase family protein [Paracoccaceae bacterium]
MTENSNFRPVDDEARDIAQSLLLEARFGALGVMLEGAPFVTRIALSADAEIISLVSTLAQHTSALKANPRCSLLIGEPGAKGDPLTHPRLTLQADAQIIGRDENLRDSWLKTHPKAKLYIDFGDFGFVRFQVRAGFLNGGFGYACQLSAIDLGLI